MIYAKLHMLHEFMNARICMELSALSVRMKNLYNQFIRSNVRWHGIIAMKLLLALRNKVISETHICSFPRELNAEPIFISNERKICHTFTMFGTRRNVEKKKMSARILSVGAQYFPSLTHFFQI